MSVVGADQMDTTDQGNENEEMVAVKVLTAHFLRENPEIELSTEADIITLEADEADPRAKMPCGHGITPSSLTQYMRSLAVEKRENTVRCCAIRDPTKETAAQARQNHGCGPDDPICNTTWEYPTCRKIALLNQEEKEFFETKLSSNFATKLNMRACPECKTQYYRDARDPATATNVRTACLFCKQEWCFRCGLTWKNANNQIVCGNESCVASLIKVVDILKSCPKKNLAGMRIPSVRACPYPACLAKFPQLVEHVTGCKYMKCPSCGGSYCHACLTTFVKNGHVYPKTCNSVEGVCENPARRQKMADVKKGQHA